MSTAFFKTGIIYALALICIAHQCHAKTFKDLKVRNCLQAGSLNVCGNLRVNGTILGPNGAIPAFDMDNGANVVPVNNIVQVSGVSGTGFVPSGIETHNGGTNDIFIEDRRWVSQYVVDVSAQVGARGTFQTIQGAIDAAVASGQKAVIIVRAGTYTENLTFHSGIFVLGADSQGLGGVVTIIGNHQYNDVGTCEIQGITFYAPTGDIFTVAPQGTGNSYFATYFCLLRSETGGVSNINPGPNNVLTYFELVCQSYAFIQNMRASGSRGLIYAAEGAFYALDPAGASPMISVDGNARVVTVLQHHFGQGDIYHVLSATARAESYFTESFNGTVAPGGRGHFVDFGTSNGYFIAEHLTLNTQSNDGFTVTGLGTYQYGDVLSVISKQIDPATTQAPEDWQPYATANVTASAVRGTSAFNSTQFNVTNGFVELFSPFFSYTTVTSAQSPYTVLATDSYLSVNTTAGAVTINLPNAPATGTTFTIKDATGNAAANNITVTTVGGVVLIDGTTSKTINANYGYIQVLFNGTSYEIYG